MKVHLINLTIIRYIMQVQQCGIPVSFALFYGSYARERQHKWSDIDVVVVSAAFDGEINAKDVNTLWRITGRIDSRIEPVACGLKQWSEDTSSMIIEIARREGQCIQAA